ncbi:hypothetical protein RUND412_003110 [Rhizina undulata]
MNPPWSNELVDPILLQYDADSPAPLEQDIRELKSVLSLTLDCKVAPELLEISSHVFFAHEDEMSSPDEDELLTALDDEGKAGLYRIINAHTYNALLDGFTPVFQGTVNLRGRVLDVIISLETELGNDIFITTSDDDSAATNKAYEFIKTLVVDSTELFGEIGHLIDVWYEKSDKIMETTTDLGSLRVLNFMIKFIGTVERMLKYDMMMRFCLRYLMEVDIDSLDIMGQLIELLGYDRFETKPFELRTENMLPSNDMEVEMARDHLKMVQYAYHEYEAGHGVLGSHDVFPRAHIISDRVSQLVDCLIGSFCKMIPSTESIYAQPRWLVTVFPHLSDLAEAAVALTYKLDDTVEGCLSAELIESTISTDSVESMVGFFRMMRRMERCESILIFVLGFIEGDVDLEFLDTLQVIGGLVGAMGGWELQL